MLLYIPNPCHDPYYNQAFEEFVFTNIPSEDILLLWRNGPAVVCGSYQNVFAEVNVPVAQEQGIAIVRRPSGGGTVFHDLGNLNYTIIKNCKSERVEYTQFLTPVISALNRMGIPVSINRTSDIAIDGKKVSGSAQRVSKNRVMHHGTLLYNAALKELTASANGMRSYFETKGIPSVPWPVTNMIDHMEDRSMSTDQFQEKLLETLKQDMPIETYYLTPEEEQQVRELADSKYRTWAWTFGKSPAFTYRRSFELNGVTRYVEYQASKGVIQNIRFEPEEPWLCDVLTGQRLDPHDIQELLRNRAEFESLYLYLF